MPLGLREVRSRPPLQIIISLSYGFGLGTANNGNVLTIQNNRVLDRSQTFTGACPERSRRNQLNRVLTAASAANSGTNCWGENFGYDIWGNLLSRSAGKTDPTCQYEPLTVAATTKNRVAGFCYDAAGNLLGEINCSAYAYDAENRMSASAAGGLYFYDGDGERVKKSSGTLYWGLSGNSPLAEGDLSGNVNKEFIFFGGKRIVRLDLPGGAVHSYFSDHLGSSNVVTNSTGTTIQEESDFYPFGGERVLTDLLPDQRYRFTGKERDLETGLDYFGARYYGSALGRFMQPDPSNAGADPEDPQSWNGYSYVGNNPLTFTDPDGLAKNVCRQGSDGKEACFWEGDYNGEYDKNQKLYWNAVSGQWQQNNSALPPASEDNLTWDQWLYGASLFLEHPVVQAYLDVFFLKAAGELGAGEKAAAGTAQGAAEAALKSEVQGILSKAGSTVGNQSIKASSREAAEQAAKEWVGQGARPIVERSTGAQVGWKSADGMKTARFTSANKASPHINLESKATGGNLHVRF